MQTNEADKRRQLNRLAIQGFLGNRDSNKTQLARALGITRGYLGDMLFDRRNPEAYLAAIAAYLGVEEEQIVLPSSDTGCPCSSQAA